MRCYTLSDPGIHCRGGKIEVGEPGRGRHLVTVPLPSASVLEADVKERGRDNVLVECEGPATDAMVLIPDQSGFRGSWRLRHPRTESQWDILVSHKCNGCERNRSLFAKGTPVAECPLHSQLDEERPAQCKIIAEGACAQGIAGRAGGGPVYLLRLTHGQAVEIVRSGRLYGRPSVIRLENQAGLVTMSNPRQDAEERLAAAKIAAIQDGQDEEPVEVVLKWGGGTARQREKNWSLRPHLVTPDGQVAVFDGQDIPGVVTILEDVSQTSGYRSGRCEAYRVVLHPGVVLQGYAEPAALSEG